MCRGEQLIKKQGYLYLSRIEKFILESITVFGKYMRISHELWVKQPRLDDRKMHLELVY